jgi:hypothetical protein
MLMPMLLLLLLLTCGKQTARAAQTARDRNPMERAASYIDVPMSVLTSPTCQFERVLLDKIN